MPRILTTSLDASPRARDRRAGRWALLVGLGLFAALLLAQAALLELVYPALAMGAGLLLYRRYPVLFVGYTWWIVFLTPEVRRLVDYQSGWSELSPVMLAPWLVAGLPALGLLRPSSGAWRDRQMLPFWLTLVGIALGYVVGLWGSGLLAATYGVLVWTVPVFFGMHVLRMSQRHYKRLRYMLKRTFLWGTLLTGLYGIVQFFGPPAWDGYWMLQSGMGSIGTPEPREVRVFSTLNSPGPFSFVAMAGVLVLFSVRSRLRLPAALAGYTALLLSLVRTAWLGWMVAVLFLVGKARQEQRRRLVAGLCAALVMVGTLAYFSPLHETVVDTMSSFTSLSSDGSFQARMEFMQEVQGIILTEPLGQGIGSAGTTTKLSSGESTTFDSGIFRVPFALGWIGALFYGGAVLLMLWRGWEATRSSPDTFATVAFGIGVSLVAQMLSGHTLIGVGGMVFWTFASVALVRPPAATNGRAPQPSAATREEEHRRAAPLARSNA